MLNILKLYFKAPLLLLSLIITIDANACTLTIGVTKSFPPYHIQKTDGSWHGISIDIARSLVNDVNCQLKVRELPWIRAIKLLEHGEIHLMSNYTRDKERGKFSSFIGPHHIERIVFIADNETSIKVNHISMLSEFNGLIGITRGNSLGKEFDKEILAKDNVSGKLVYIKDNVKRHQMLFSGRIDAMFDDELSAIYLLDKYQKANKKFKIRFSLKGNPVYFGISVKGIEPTLQKKLNTSWLKLTNSHTLDDIYRSYGLELDRRELAIYPTVLINTTLQK
jgi:polar amino acid transport system substrate-binding protein